MTAPLLDAIASWYLVGLTVTVALVVYPGFALVGAREWSSYHAAHARRMTIAVAPAWALEGLATIWWLAVDPSSVLAWSAGLFALLTVIFTVFGAVPAHQRLETNRDQDVLDRLRRAHLVRSVAWLAAATCATAAVVNQLR